MKVEELESKIKEEKNVLVGLEAKYEAEPDEKKQTKLEFKISRKEESIDRLIDRQNVLLDREVANTAQGKDKDVEEEKDKDLCPECGGHLIFVGKDNKDEVDVFQCQECGELFLDE